MTPPTIDRAACNLPPFPSFPSVSRHVEVGSTADSIERLIRGIDTGEAIGLIVGPPGTGKSQVCEVLADRMAAAMTVVRLVDVSLTSAASLDRALARQLNIQAAADSLHESIIERMEQTDQPRVLLILDEAQSLPAAVLESVRRLTNVMAGGVRQMTAILAGGPGLDETLAEPSLQSLAQRIATRCYLHPMTNDQTARYVAETISRLGGQVHETIEPAAIDAVHHACSGVPRLINQLMTLAIDVADESSDETITVSVVERAWASLQQLPDPMIDQPHLVDPASTPAATIVFGPLAGDAAERPAEVPVVAVIPAPAIDAVPATPAPELLFGDFEEEEILQKIGSRTAESLITPVAQSPADVDDVLPAEPQASSTPSQEEELVEVQTEVLQLQRFAQTQTTPEPMATTPYAPSPFSPVLWLAEDGESTTEGLVDDDRDLLVIEDQVAVEVAPAPPISQARDGDENASTVDFRSLLEKMRRPQAV